MNITTSPYNIENGRFKEYFCKEGSAIINLPYDSIPENIKIHNLTEKIIEIYWQNNTKPYFYMKHFESAKIYRTYKTIYFLSIHRPKMLIAKCDINKKTTTNDVKVMGQIIENNAFVDIVIRDESDYYYTSTISFNPLKTDKAMLFIITHNPLIIIKLIISHLSENKFTIDSSESSLSDTTYLKLLFYY